jgi:hypothetical protein
MSVYFLHHQLGVRSGNIYNSIFRISHKEKRRRRKFLGIQIQLKNDSIDFFYIVDNVEHPANIHRPIHLFSFPLDTPEKTDYFLLNTIDLHKNIYPSLNDTRLFYASALPGKQLFEVKGHNKLINIHEILLCLFEELFNSESDINKYSPVISDSIKGMLNKSSVFSLVRKKFNFYKALYEWKESEKVFKNEKSGKRLSISKLKTTFNEFLESILNDSLVRIIPISNFDGNNWFQNPEQELENLKTINAEHNINDVPIRSIQNYFLKKHAVLSALKISFKKVKKDPNKAQTKFEILIFDKLNINKVLYNLIIGLQLTAFMSFCILLSCWLRTSYDYANLLIGIGIISFVFSIIFIFIGQRINKKGNLNLFMPRIFIAMTIVLYGIVGSEVILKNQFLVKLTTVEIAIICGILILPLSIYYECLQHSPHYKLFTKKLYNYKILPILIYAFNIATLLVLTSQIIVSHNFIDNTNIYSAQVFSNELDSLKKMRDQYKAYNEEILKVQGQNWYTLSLILGQNFSKYKNTIDNESLKKLIAESKELYLYESEINQSLMLYDIFKRDVRISKELRADIKSRILNTAFIIGYTTKQVDPIHIDFSNKYKKV